MKLLNERIDVIAYFREGDLVPLRIRRDSGIYRIRRVHYTWRQFTGRVETIHFTASTDTREEVEMVLDLWHLTWMLRRFYRRDDIGTDAAAAPDA